MAELVDYLGYLVILTVRSGFSDNLFQPVSS